MTKKRNFYRERKLGSTRVDLDAEKKKGLIKRIIKYNEKYAAISADYKKMTAVGKCPGKHLPRTTFNRWRKNGHKYLDSENASVNCRLSYKQNDVKKKFEDTVMERIKSSKTDVEGSYGLLLILEKVKMEEEFFLCKK